MLQNNCFYRSFLSWKYMKRGLSLHYSVMFLSIICLLGLFSTPSNSQVLASGKSKYLGNAITYGNSTYMYSDFASYWNQVSPGNDGKWGSVESTKDTYSWTQLDNVYNYAVTNGFLYKHHTLVWGSQQPSWITSLDSANQRTQVEEWIKLVGARYPKMNFVDVVNEPFHSVPSYSAALGGSGTTGWDWVVTAFTWARKYMPPSTKLLLNEYNVIGSDAVTTNYIKLIDTLMNRGLIDGIGVQCHYFEFQSYEGDPSGTYAYSISTLKGNLDKLAATGLPIYITEFDINEPTDSVQTASYKKYFPLVWEHTGVKGVTLWGYKYGDVWKASAYLLNSNGTERPALTWLRSYLANGNYQSYQSGDWSDMNTWSKYNGSSWVHPAYPPSFDSDAVAILSGHTVAVDVPDSTNKLTIASGGTLVVNSGVEFRVRKGVSTPIGLCVTGSVLNHGTIIVDTPSSLSFASGGVYGHEQDGGAVPIANWISGDTCRFDGIQSTMPSNVNQNFSNVVWNCSNQTGNLSLGWNGNTIGGNVTVQNTGTGKLFMCSPAAGAVDTITITGSVIQSGGQFAANGTDNGNTTIVINHAGSVTLTGGTFSLSQGTQGGTGTTTWNLSNGNISISGVSVQNATTTPNGAKFIFSKSGTQTLTLGSGNTISVLPIEVKSGTSLSTGTSVLMGTGMFALDSAATLYCSHAGGLDSLLKTTGTVSLSKYGTYIFNGSSAQTAGTLMPDTIGALTINNSAGVTLSKSVLVNGTVTMQSGTLSLASGALSYGSTGSLTYSAITAQTTTSAEFPATNSPKNIVITNSKGVTLHASRQIAESLNLSAVAKFILGDNNFTAASILNSGKTYFVVTQGTGLLRLPTNSSSTMFPLGTKTGYCPVTVINSGTADTLGISAIDDSTAAGYGGRVLVKWNINSSGIGAKDSLKLAWVYALENTAFASDMSGNAKIYLKSDSNYVEAGSGAYAYQLTTTPFSVARGGVTSFGSFYVGSFAPITGVTNDETMLPQKFVLNQNYPNPFNPSTVISYQLPVSSKVTLKVYDMLGKEVTTLVDTKQAAGTYKKEWNAAKLASGVYFYRIQTETFTSTKKLILMK
jgi:endo-1,4-beta-xylanase